ncbi:MAG: chemotaxis protein [Lewinellaceae bacterium]|nr:hypothetical protein [Phaeodactylibacter sp.]MCB9347344.1 chemotaxis protein [Lewinellaceae bacterium]
MTIFNKIRWVASILLVFFIVLMTNLIDKDNFNKLSYSVTTIYEDRIVASDLLFEMSRIIQKKEIAIISTDTTFPGNGNSESNRELNNLIERYNQTKLTEKEKFVFNQLQDELKTLERKEQETENVASSALLKSIDKINQHLYDLSKIQLQEGRQQVFISDKAKDNINLFTQVEIIFLIIMAVMIQVIILYKPKQFSEK